MICECAWINKTEITNKCVSEKFDKKNYSKIIIQRKDYNGIFLNFKQIRKNWE